MNLVTIEHLSKQMGERPLFEDANLLINEGDRIGLIGVNGSGKSTLLRLAAGLEAPDNGSVTVWGGVHIEYLAQEPTLDDSLTVLEQIFRSDSPQIMLLREYEAASDALEHTPDDAGLQDRMAELSAELDRTGGWAAEANAKAVLTRLGITEPSASIATLSGGERKRVALARALIVRADSATSLRTSLLILDEPTNHIDADTVAWLEEYLASMPGALLLVTHDRYFLDRVVNRIVELDRRQLVSFTGNYTRYLETRAERHERLADAEHKRQRLLHRELEWLRRAPMARGTKQQARKQRVEEMLRIRYDSGDEKVSIALASRRLGKQVLSARALCKRYGERNVVDGVDFDLEPGDRIGIVGPNGAGKSTLLDILVGKTPPDSGAVLWGDTARLGYYDQRSEGLNDHMRVIELIEKEAPLIQTKDGDRVEAARMLEWFLFPRPVQWARIGSLSGGERRRLYLLRTLVHQPNVLFLDEPTNDLDIQTLTVLEEFLDHFAGCVVVASHDRYFLDRTVNFLVSMENGRVGPRDPAPYTTFERLRREAIGRQPAEQVSAVAAKRPDKALVGEPLRKLTWTEQRQVSELEQRIQQLEVQKAAILHDMNACNDDYLRLGTLAEKLDATEVELDSATVRWLELSEMGTA